MNTDSGSPFKKSKTSRVLSLLTRLKQERIKVRLVNGQLKIHAPKGKLHPQLVKELKDQKDEIIEFLQRSEDKLKKYASVEPTEKKEYYRMSSPQQRLYVIQQMNIENTAYNVPQMIELEGEVEIKRLEKTFRALVARHESLRTSFHMGGTVPRQSVHAPGEMDFKIGYHESDNGIIRNFVRSFDLSQAPLLRVGLVRIAPLRHVLMVDMHHIISDGVSHSILIGDFLSLFSGKPLPALRLQYKDYSQWQQGETVQQLLKEQEKYWLREFQGGIPVLHLPTDYPRPMVQSIEGSVRFFDLSQAQSGRLDQVTRREGVTRFMLLLAVYNVFLFKLSGQEDIVVGTATAGRRHADLEPIIGMFVNTLALRNYPLGEKTFAEFLAQVKKNTIKAFDNQEYPFEDLVEKVALERDLSRNPLCDVMFEIGNNAVPGVPGKNVKEKEEPPGLKAKTYNYERRTAKFDLFLFAFTGREKLAFSFEYCTKLFKADTMERFIQYFKNIISAILTNHDIKLSEIEIIPEEERKQLLYDFNDTAVSYPKEKTIHELFERQAEQTPDNIAVVGPLAIKYRTYRTYMTYISYRELNNKSDQLAHQLKEKGARPDTIVGLMVDRSVLMAIGLLGILKAGGSYLPIDPQYPGERRRYMMKDGHIDILLTDSSNSPSKILLAAPESQIIKVDKSSSTFTLTSTSRQAASAANLVYIMYTSGSTGKPKGVMVEHRNVVRLVKNTNYVEFKENQRILQTGALEFDASTFEIWGALLNGLTLYLLDKGQILNPKRLKETIKKYHISTIWMTSPLFNQMMQADVEIFAGLTNLLVGGDALSPAHINRVKTRFPALKVINGYGPTENTTFSTTFLIDKEYTYIPIGSPIANSTAIIIDKAHYLQPVKVAGELCVGGEGVSRGYLNDPELTAEKFLRAVIGHSSFVISSFKKLSKSTNSVDNQCPMTNDRFYKTGDLARWLPDGNIEFLGRIDHQVKIRGFRIELGEIEAQLLKHADIKNVVVIQKEWEQGDKYLCAYIVSDIELSVSELREYLAGKLPDYMIPSYFIPIEQIPLVPNGKIDRKALPEPELKAGEDDIAPRDQLEETLAGIWVEVLGIEKDNIGIDSDFFHLGGHSLKAILLISQIHCALNVKVELTVVFTTPTIRALADHIRHIDSSAVDRFIAIEPTEKKEYYPLSSAQESLYFLWQLDQKNIAYNMPMVRTLAGEVDITRFEKTFTKMVHRHEVLRTSFEIIQGELVQRVHDKVEFEIEYDVPHEKSFIRSFDLSQAPLLRVGIVKADEEKHILMVDMHHIISDQVSLGIYVREFLALYRGERLTELRLQYKDYSQWQYFEKEKGTGQQQENYWLDSFKDSIPCIHLPTDYPRPGTQSFEGDIVIFDIHDNDTKSLSHLAAQEGASMFMILLALYNVLLSKITGQEDIVVGTPVEGRRHADLRKIIGMFVNMLAVRNRPEGDKSFKGFLREVKHAALNAFENQDYPFEDLVDKLAVNRQLNRNPLFDVVFRYAKIEEAPGATPAKEKENKNQKQVEHEFKTSKFDLQLNVSDTGTRLFAFFSYKTKLFKHQTIERLVSYFKKLLSEVIKTPEKKLSQLEMISDQERRELIKQKKTRLAIKDPTTDQDKKKSMKVEFNF
ncbi:MAG: amino acid adenylation domain-containing protein [Candidatus Aminicenantes bacterium]|nr:MAG: amino acid adenylation domain-containing protein [Candidatus Aminicenantes bacterium]